MYSLRLSVLLLSCVLLSSCHADDPKSDTSPARSEETPTQLVELPETGWSLYVPEDWQVQQKEHANPATGLVNTLVTNGDLSEESFQQGRGDAIHITSLACSPEQPVRLAQNVLQQDNTKVIDEFHPGDPFMPFAEGMGYEVAFESDSSMTSHAFLYEITSGDRCYKISLENMREHFEETRETYIAIIKSVRFSEA